jgi:hypothetical protein
MQSNNEVAPGLQQLPKPMHASATKLLHCMQKYGAHTCPPAAAVHVGNIILQPLPCTCAAAAVPCMVQPMDMVMQPMLMLL